MLMIIFLALIMVGLGANISTVTCFIDFIHLIQINFDGPVCDLHVEKTITLIGKTLRCKGFLFYILYPLTWLLVCWRVEYG